MPVWLITGAAGGLGRAFASAALERGDAVALAARDSGRLADLAAAPNALAVELDVDDRGAVFAAVARVHEHFGRIDVLVNNARSSRPTSSGRCGSRRRLRPSCVRRGRDT
jgi:NADP-dependent 3-hydroxy acid dehydrogenase YdfG